MLKILIVEDEAQNRAALHEMLCRLGHTVVECVNGEVALNYLSRERFDLILSDIRMPKVDGLKLFESNMIREEITGQRTPFVFMTAYGRIEDAISVLKKGAHHFLMKPLRKKDLLPVLEEVEKRKLLEARETQTTVHASEQKYIAQSKTMQSVIELSEKVAASAVSVIISGESGTGKEHIARYIHEKSMRATQKLVSVNASAIPENLFESEFFGYEKGAFTGADKPKVGLLKSADKGTVFIDEIQSMSAAHQTKLLRVIQEGVLQPIGSLKPCSVDLRWITATNTTPEMLVKSGVLREDLYYRLGVVQISLPPLRDRTDDIIVLSQHFISSFCEREKRSPLAITDEVTEVFLSYPWPGNVRELKNVIERAVVIADSKIEKLDIDLLPAHISQTEAVKEIRIAIGATLQSVEDRLISETLKNCKGDKAKAASVLGVNPRTLYRWVNRSV